jgi:hypothetical protein
VTTSALHFAAAARSTSERIKPRSFIKNIWNQNGFVAAAATSSIEQIDMVDKQNGIPAACAARQAEISPSRNSMPQRPTGARANGSAAGSPRIVERVLRSATSIKTRWRNWTRSKSEQLDARILFGVGAALNEIEERAGHLAGGNMPQVLDAGHTFHGQAIIATCAGL